MASAFAWDIDVETSTMIVDNGSLIGDESADSFVEPALTYSSAALLFLMAITAWRTVGTKTSELLQFLWSFGVIWGGAQLLSEVEMDADIAAAKTIAYDIVGWGTLYHVLPQAVTRLLVPQVEKLPVPSIATHAITLGSQLLPTVGMITSVTGSTHFTEDQLAHMPLALIALIYAGYTLFGLLGVLQQSAPSTLTMSTAVSSAVSFVVFQMHSEGAVTDLLCACMMPVACLAFYTVAIEQEMKHGVQVKYVAGLPWLPALPGSALLQASQKIEQVQQVAKAELGFARP